MNDQKLLPCTVIFTVILGRKNYIAGHSMRADNKLVPQHHTDVAQAIPFTSEAETKKFLSRIINHHNRVYETEPAELPAKNFKAVKLNRAETNSTHPEKQLL